MVVHLPPVAAAVVPVVFVPVGWRPLAVAVVVAMVVSRAVAAVVVAAQAQVGRQPVAVVLVPVGWRPRAVAVAFLSPVIFLPCSRPCRTEASG